MRKIFILQENHQHSYTLKLWADNLAKLFNHEIHFINIDKKISYKEFASILEEQDASILLIELKDKKKIQFYLNLCSGLRLPYVFVPAGKEPNLQKISVPITFLVEDKEKVPFASAFGRFCNSEILIYQPKDYGDKAQETINQAKTLFNSFSLKYSIINAKKGSDGVEKEAVINALNDHCSLVIISASRQYGLDDIIFGSKERNILKNAQIPVMLINPRADLYALCD